MRALRFHVEVGYGYVVDRDSNFPMDEFLCDYPRTLSILHSSIRPRKRDILVVYDGLNDATSLWRCSVYIVS